MCLQQVQHGNCLIFGAFFFLNFNGVLPGNEKVKVLVLAFFCNTQCKFY